MNTETFKTEIVFYLSQLCIVDTYDPNTGLVMLKDGDHVSLAQAIAQAIVSFGTSDTNYPRLYQAAKDNLGSIDDFHKTVPVIAHVTYAAPSEELKPPIQSINFLNGRYIIDLTLYLRPPAVDVEGIAEGIAGLFTPTNLGESFNGYHRTRCGVPAKPSV